MEPYKEDNPYDEEYKQLMKCTRNSLSYLRKVIDELEYVNIQKEQVKKLEVLYNTLDTKKLSICDLRSYHKVMCNWCKKYDKLLEEKEKLDANNCNRLDGCENKTKSSKINLITNEVVQKLDSQSEISNQVLLSNIENLTQQIIESTKNRNVEPVKSPPLQLPLPLVDLIDFERKQFELTSSIEPHNDNSLHGNLPLSLHPKPISVNNTPQLSPNISQRTKPGMIEVERLEADTSGIFDCEAELSAPKIPHCRQNKQIDYCQTNTAVSSKTNHQTNMFISDDKIPKTPKRKTKKSKLKNKKKVYTYKKCTKKTISHKTTKPKLINRNVKNHKKTKKKMNFVLYEKSELSNVSDNNDDEVMIEVERFEADTSGIFDCEAELSAPKIPHCRQNKQIDYCQTNTAVSSKTNHQTNMFISDDKIPKTPKRKTKKSKLKNKKKVYTYKKCPKKTISHKNIKPTLINRNVKNHKKTKKKMNFVLYEKSELSNVSDNNNEETIQVKTLKVLTAADFKDKSYFQTVDKKLECKLCSYNDIGLKIVRHYKEEHSVEEMLPSRVSVDNAEILINESVRENFGILNVQDLNPLGDMINTTFTCVFCYSTYCNITYFYDHITCHTGEYRYNCKVCKMTYPNILELEEHILKHSNYDKSEGIYHSLHSNPVERNIIFGYLCSFCYYIQLDYKRIEMHMAKWHCHEDKMFNSYWTIFRVNMSIEDADNTKPITDYSNLVGCLPPILKDKVILKNVNQKYQTPQETSVSTLVEQKKKAINDEVSSMTPLYNEDEAHFQKLNIYHWSLADNITLSKCKNNQYSTVFLNELFKHINMNHLHIVWDRQCDMCNHKLEEINKQCLLKNALEHMVPYHLVLKNIQQSNYSNNDEEIDEFSNAREEDCMVENHEQQNPIISYSPLDIPVEQTNTIQASNGRISPVSMPCTQDVRDLSETEIGIFGNLCPKKNLYDQYEVTNSWPDIYIESGRQIVNNGAPINGTYCLIDTMYQKNYLKKIKEFQANKMKSKFALKDMTSVPKLLGLFKCMKKQCSQVFSDKIKFTSHMQYHISNMEKKKNQTNNTKQFNYCAYCFKTFDEVESLATHISEKYSFCKYFCPFCFYRAYTPHHVLVHQTLIHTTNKPKIIQLEYDEGVNDSLTEILMVVDYNDFIMPYKCNVGSCTFSCFIPRDFIYHLNKEHGHCDEFCCYICDNQDNSKGFITFQPSLMIKHLILHNINIYQCIFCLFGSEFNDLMMNHLAMEHFEYESVCLERSVKSDSLDSSKVENLKIIKLKPSINSDLLKIVSPGISSLSENPEMLDNEISTQRKLSVEHLTEESIAPPFIELNKLFFCKECDIVFSNSKDYKSHLDNFQYKQSNEHRVCVFCAEYFKTPTQMMEHVKCHGPNRFKCFRCSFNAPSRRSIGYHMRTKHGVNALEFVPLNTQFTDIEIDKFIAKKKTYKKELSLPLQKKSLQSQKTPPKRCITSFKCGECTLKSLEMNSIISHLKDIHNIDEHEMETHKVNFLCNDDSEDVFEIRKMNSSKDSNERIGHNNLFNQNIDKIDPEIPTIIAQDKNTKQFSPDTIGNIPMIHIFSNPIGCTLCTYNTKVRSNLILHLNIHKNGQCNTTKEIVNPVLSIGKSELMFDKMINLSASSCEVMLSEKTEVDELNKKIVEVSLINNLNTELFPQFIPKNKRFQCSEETCNQQFFLDVDLLKTHMSFVHEDYQFYLCPHCPPNSIQTKEVKINNIVFHLLHHTENLYKCQYCDYIDFNRDEMRKHMKKAHLPLIVSENKSNIIVIRQLEKEDSYFDRKIIQIELSEAQWICNLCTSSTKYTETEIISHLFLTHKATKMYRCPMCLFEREDDNAKQFKEHFKAQHPNVAYKSQKVCDKITDAEKLPIQSNNFMGQTTNNQEQQALESIDPRMPPSCRGIPIESIYSSKSQGLSEYPKSAKKSSVKVRKQKMFQNDFKEDNQLGTISKRGQFVCPKCHSFETTDLENFRDHLCKEINNNRWKCMKCFEISDSPKKMAWHVKKHGIGTNYEKMENTARFKWVDRVIEHQHLLSIEFNKQNAEKDVISVGPTIANINKLTSEKEQDFSPVKRVVVSQITPPMSVEISNLLNDPDNK